MRRTLLGLVVASTLLIGFFLVYFSFSGFRTSGQSYLTSLSDFFFMADSYQRQAFDNPRKLNDDAFASVVKRFSASTHNEVRERGQWTLKQWGEKAGPRLVAAAERATDPYLQVGIARGLAAIAHPQTAEIAVRFLQLHSDDISRVRRDLIEVLGETDNPQALKILIDLHQRHGNSVGNVYEAIGSCGGTDYLLAELEKASTPEEIRSLLWPLAVTRDPRGIKAVARHLLHRDADVRIRAYSALGQSTGVEAVAPLLRVLQEVDNEYILSSAINQVLARSSNRGQPELVPYLAKLVSHPTLSWDARYALARVGGPAAVAVLQQMAGRDKPERVMEHLDVLGDAALPILQGYLRHPESRVRRHALYKTEELLNPAVRPLIVPLLEDEDPYLRKQVKRALFDLDTLELFRSFTEILPESLGRSAWYGFRSDMSWDFRKSFREGLKSLTLLHWIGVAVSGLLGLLLIFNRVRIFESYRFNLFVSFLLAEGLFGNFFFLGRELHDPERVFTIATGIHLLLLIGFLFQERERLPGELRNRFERLGGASLWLITPALLYFGTPSVAEGLRQILHDFYLFLPYLAFMLTTVILVIEQWAIPLQLWPRRARFERLQAGILSAVSTGLFVWPLFLVLIQRLAAGDQDGAVFAGVLVAPLIWLLIFHLRHIGLLRSGSRMQLTGKPPGERLVANADGDRINIRLRRPRSIKRLMIQAGLVLAAGSFTAARVGQFRGDMGSLLLAMFAGLLGAALTGFLIEAVRSRFLLQVRGGYVRCGLTRFGATLSDGGWRRRPHFTSSMRTRLASDEGRGSLSSKERDWLLKVRDESMPAPKGVALGSVMGGGA